MARGNIIAEGKREKRDRAKSDVNVDVHTHVCLLCERRREKDTRGDVLAGSARGHAWNPEQTIPSLRLPPLFPSVFTSLPLSISLSLSLCLSRSLFLFLSSSSSRSSRSANRPLVYLSLLAFLPDLLLFFFFFLLPLLFFFLLSFFWSMPSKKLIYHTIGPSYNPSSSFLHNFAIPLGDPASSTNWTWYRFALS